MKINGIEIKACIFDLDGTILDSCSVWSNVDRNFFARRGMEVPADYAKAICAFGLDESAKYTKNRFNLPESEEEIIHEWLNEVVDTYKNEVVLKPHAKDFLDKLKENDIPLCIATANTKECYIPCLERIGIIKDFEMIYDVKDFNGGKHDPEIFNHIARELNLLPEEIMVFEDSLVAIHTAKKANFKICGVYETTCKDEKEKMHESDIYIKDFKEILI